MATINPLWAAYNQVHNEGGEGYNPHEKHLVKQVGEPLWSKLMDKRNRNSDVMEAISMDDPRYEELKAENAVLEVAIKDAMAKGV